MEFINITRDLLNNLRLQIICGDFEPGHKINEVHLSRQMGISRGPTREALRILENEDLVFYVPRKGVFVTKTSLDNFVELYHSREMIECYAIDILKEKKIKNSTLLSASIEKSLSQTALSSDSTPQEKFNFVKRNIAFHASLVESAQNSILTNFYTTVFNKLALYIFKYTDPQLMNTEQVKEHIQIMECVNNGSYKKAKDYVSKHIRSISQMIEVKIKQKT